MKHKKKIARFLIKPAIEALGGPCGEWRGKVRLLAHDILKEDMAVPVVQHIKGCAACRLFYLDCVESRDSFVKSIERDHAAEVSVRSWNHCRRAERFKADGALAEAISEYKKAIELDSKNITACRGLAEVLNAQGKYLDGVEILKRAVHLNPTDYEAYLNLQGFMRLYGKLADIVQVWREVYDIVPKTEWVYRFLGTALESKGLYEEAVSIYKEAIKKGDYASAHESLADAYATLRMHVGAIDEYKKAIERDRGESGVFYKIKLSRVLAALTNYKEAEIVARDAVAQNPKDHIAHANLAEFLRLHGNLEESVLEYRKAVKISPKSDWAQKGLALALQMGEAPNTVSDALAKAIEKELGPKYELRGR